MNESELYSQINMYKAKISELEQAIRNKNREMEELEELSAKLRSIVERMNNSNEHARRVLKGASLLVNAPLPILQPLLNLNQGGKFSGAVNGIYEAISKANRKNIDKDNEKEAFEEKIAYYNEKIRQCYAQINAIAAEGAE